jgi:hypothetical protein
MNLRCSSALLAASVGVMLVTVPAGAQRPTGPAAKATALRLPDGRPDLQGVWDFRTLTPLERPDEFAGQGELTAEQVSAREARARQSQVDRPPPRGSVGGYNQFWFDTRADAGADRRTSLIVDPPNGKVPPLVPNARHQVGSLGEDLPSELPVRYRAGGKG